MNRKRGLAHWKHLLAVALTRYRRDAIVIAVAAVAGLVVVGWILSNQTQFSGAPSWFPGGADRREFTAEFEDASGLLPGTAQPVSVAGVEVGVVKDVELNGRVADVTMTIDEEDLDIYNDATLLVRPRTALKDMFVALEPGSSESGELEADGRIPVSQTQPTVDVQEILANLDTDTRSYLRLLLAGAAEGFGAADSKDGVPDPSAVADLSRTLRAFDPFAEDARTLTEELGKRRENLKDVIHGMNGVMTQLGAVNGDIATLVRSADETFEATGSQDRRLQAALTELPGTLDEVNRALAGTIEFGRQLGISTSKLHGFARNLAPAERALRPFATQTLPVISNQLRPFTGVATPVVRRAKPAVTKIAASTPGLDRTLSVFARFFNALGNNPAGSEEGYLFWGAWLFHNLPSVLSLQDAHGAAARGMAMLTCPQLDALNTVQVANPILASITKLANLPDRLVVCK